LVLGKDYGKSQFKRQQAIKESIMPDHVSPAPTTLSHSKKVNRRRAKAERVLKDQMIRLAQPGNVLQRTVALYQAACRYECAVRPPLPEGMTLEPVYLPRPAKARMDRYGNFKFYPEAFVHTDEKGRSYSPDGTGVPGAFGRAGQVKLKPPAYRLVEYRLVPKDRPIAEPVHAVAPVKPAVRT
jgi:hypothetical protein